MLSDHSIFALAVHVIKFENSMEPVKVDGQLKNYIYGNEFLYLTVERRIHHTFIHIILLQNWKEFRVRDGFTR